MSFLKNRDFTLWWRWTVLFLFMHFTWYEISGSTAVIETLGVWNVWKGEIETHFGLWDFAVSPLGVFLFLWAKKDECPSDLFFFELDKRERTFLVGAWMMVGYSLGIVIASAAFVYLFILVCAIVSACFFIIGGIWLVLSGIETILEDIRALVLFLFSVSPSCVKEVWKFMTAERRTMNRS